MDNCIFCKIVAGEIPSSKVYEDDNILAFLDISQVTPGHTLVIPKKHVRNVLEMSSDDAAQLFSYVPKLAKAVKQATQANGLNIINNNEAAAGQSVFHTHIHLIPRFDENDDLKLSFIEHEPDFEALTQLAQKISDEV